jgi:hypothetical protein
MGRLSVLRYNCAMQEAQDTPPTGQTNEGETDDLGFTHIATKSGLVFIRRDGRQVTELSGAAASEFLKKVKDADFAMQQQIMARITGNYKRGNERQAAKHTRNR